MRKIFSLGLLAFLFSIFAVPLVAGTVEDCEELKSDGSPRSLYALCLAEANAGNENAASHIRENQDKMISEDCPCWDASSFEGALNAICFELQDYDFASFEKDYPDDGWDGPENVGVIAGLVPASGYDSTSCALNRNQTSITIEAATNELQDLSCSLLIWELLCPSS